MPELERVYNIPLRKGYRKAPKYMRANKAIRVVREFLERHMKSKNVKLGPFLNSEILKNGRKNVVHHIEVKTVKEKDIVKAELASAKDLSFLEFEKKEERKGLLSRLGKKKEESISSKETATKEEKLEEKKEELEKEKIEVETSKKKVEELQKEVMKGKLKGKAMEEKEAVKSPRKSLEAETYGRPSKKIQHKKPKKE